MTITQEVEGPFGVPVPKSEEAATLQAERAQPLRLDRCRGVLGRARRTRSRRRWCSLWAIVGVGYFGPAVIWISFMPVLFIAYSYFHLNRKDPDCGASYSWLSKLMSPYVGWFNGWVQVATSALFCVLAPVTAAQNTLAVLR